MTTATLEALETVRQIEMLHDRQGHRLDDTWTAWRRGGLYRLQAEGEQVSDVDRTSARRSFRAAAGLVIRWEADLATRLHTTLKTHRGPVLADPGGEERVAGENDKENDP